MRYIVAFLVFGLLASWSVLVHSYSRTATDILKYDNLLKDCQPLQKLFVDSSRGWKALASFYPPSLMEKFAEAKKNIPAGGRLVIDPQQINHLVEIYLRSHSLSACGHKEVHETVGTPCSVSKGTEFSRLYEDVLSVMYKGGAMDSRALLYLLESEPANWSIDEPYFFMKDRIVPSTVSVNDIDVEAKRKQLIREGFQTASHWSYNDVRKAIINSSNGEKLSNIDSLLGVSRGELRMVLSNCLVRPLFLLKNWDNESYEGRLDGLIPFVVENIGRDLGVGDLNQIRTELDVEPSLNIATTAASVLSVVQADLPKKAVPVALPETVVKEEKPVVQAVMVKAVAPVSKDLDKSSKKESSSFARAYGGSRFHMGWGN